jgi:hypothetical protein
MNKVTVEHDKASYVLDVDLGEFKCEHVSTHIDKACCSIFDIGSSGYIECGCSGQDSVVCNNPNCTGIDDEDVERLTGGGFDCE